MKFGIIGGVVVLILTIVFSMIALQNNRKVNATMDAAFGLPSKGVQTAAPIVSAIPQTTMQAQTTEGNETKADVDKWKNFQKKFEGFNEKFEDMRKGF